MREKRQRALVYEQQVDTETSVVPMRSNCFSEQTVLKRNRRVYIHARHVLQ